MRFNLETSNLLYEVRYESLTNLEDYTYQKLYEDISGNYFIYFQKGKHSKDLINTGVIDLVIKKHNCFLDENDIELWKYVSKKMQKVYPKEFPIIDCQEEEDLKWMHEIAAEDLPF